MLLENRYEDIEAVLLRRQFRSLDRVNLELLWEEDFADEDFMEKLNSHDLCRLLW